MNKLIFSAMLTMMIYGPVYGASFQKLCLPKNNSCSHCTSYSCAAGYYGTTTDGASGCNRCPQYSYGLFARYGTSTGGNDTEKTDCYLANGAKGTDETGTWIIDTSNYIGSGLKPVGCYWSE